MGAPVCVLTKLVIKEDKIKDFLRATTVVVRATNRLDEGCIFYNLHQDTRKKSIFFMIEKWESRELLNGHLEAQHTKQYLNNEFGAFAKEGPKIYILSDAIFNVTNKNVGSSSKN